MPPLEPENVRSRAEKSARQGTQRGLWTVDAKPLWVVMKRCPRHWPCIPWGGMVYFASRGRVLPDPASKSGGFQMGVTETIELPIEGMSCASCASHVERALRQTDGVRVAGVNLPAERATVRYEPDRASSKQLADAVTSWPACV